MTKEISRLRETKEAEWHVISDDGEWPLDGEYVIVTDGKVYFMQTFFGRFTKGIIAWMSVPEYNESNNSPA